ncbi:MAG TPA: c-type cytochrome [Acidobacteriaceae bacterium]
MFRTFVMAAAIAAFSVLSPGALYGQEAAAPQGPPPSAGAHKPMTLPKPVNLKVLPSNTTPDQVMKIMGGFSQQLGVHCTFCHAEDAATKHPNFASDLKPEKNVARTMMRMTEDINAKYMSQIHDPDAAPDQRTVTCGTCHRGHNMPVTFKPTEHGGPGMGNMEHPAAPPKP